MALIEVEERAATPKSSKVEVSELLVKRASSPSGNDSLQKRRSKFALVPFWIQEGRSSSPYTLM